MDCILKQSLRDFLKSKYVVSFYKNLTYPRKKDAERQRNKLELEKVREEKNQRLAEKDKELSNVRLALTKAGGGEAGD